MFPAWTLIGVAGNMILLTNIQTANLLERGRGTIVLSLHTMNELSAVVLVLFKVSNYIKYIIIHSDRKGTRYYLTVAVGQRVEVEYGQRFFGHFLCKRTVSCQTVPFWVFF